MKAEASVPDDISGEAPFVDRVDYWLQEALDNDPPNFTALVRAMPGVDPVFVLNRLDSPRFASHKLARRLANEARTAVPVLNYPHPYPVPHPLDFDWRYGEKSIGILGCLLARTLTDGRCAALIGAPTLLTKLADKGFNHQIYLIDRNPLWQTLVPKHALHTLDATTDECPTLLEGQVDLVVIDPPWYPAAYASFMWFARQLLRRGGTLAVSVLPIGTRPTAEHDRAAVIRTAEAHGFRLVQRESGALSYRTPPFEINAFLAAGLRAPMYEWRIADLWLFDADKECSVARPEVSDLHRWQELEFRGVRVKFDTQHDRGSLALERLVANDILPSVSARSPERERASVWTSGNRVFSCENAAALFALCRDTLWTASTGFDSSYFNDPRCAVLAKLQRIIETELAEYGGFSL